MGAAVSSGHRANDICSYTNDAPLKISPAPSFCGNQSDNHIAKKPRLSLSRTLDYLCSSNKSASRLSKYPQTKSQLKREVHAPYRASKFGSAFNSNRAERNLQSGAGEGVSRASMGNVCRRKIYEVARDTIWQSVRILNKEPECDELDISDDLSIEVIENLEERHEDGSVVNSDHMLQDANGLKVSSQKIDGKILENGIIPASSSEVTHLTKVEYAEKVLKSLSLTPDQHMYGMPPHKKLFESATRYNPKLIRLQSDIQLQETRLESIRSLCLEKKLNEEEVEAVDSAHLREPFVPLEEEDEEVVAKAFSNFNRRKVLIAHESSNIEITGGLLQCLRPGAWLNDEVINLYLELLKERERRDPQKFLNCHFFNTFFYKKLIGGRSGYDYKAVKRWTTQRKLGYGLIECEKIFVPIHKEVHWCLAVINKKEKKFQYLDSLGGIDSQVFKVLARYIVDEVKDKSGQEIDVSSWDREFVTELPEQENGYDCGVFMIKYIDFFSRGMGLNFSQEHMPYFRLRTAKEILQLRAD
ncbi:hypothetical protein V2J09_023230 [Rumex salicifolius]